MSAGNQVTLLANAVSELDPKVWALENVVARVLATAGVLAMVGGVTVLEDVPHEIAAHLPAVAATADLVPLPMVGGSARNHPITTGTHMPENSNEAGAEFPSNLRSFRSSSDQIQAIH